MTEATIRSNNINYPLYGDSEVFRDGDGYERLLIVGGWNPANATHPARVYIRVDRLPELSFAKVDVWVREAGWQEIKRLPVEEFWRDMPGYMRWHGYNSDTATAKVASNLLADLVALVEDEGVVF